MDMSQKPIDPTQAITQMAKDMQTQIASNEDKIKTLDQKIKNMVTRPKVSEVCNELITFVLSVEKDDPLLYETKHQIKQGK